MQQEILLDILKQNQFTSHFSLGRVSQENSSLRLNKETATGQGIDVEFSRELISRGYGALKELVESSSDEDWLRPVDTPFFGTVTRIRLFVHALFHTSNHAGQISLTLARGSK